jgi:hypothetical protein
MAFDERDGLGDLDCDDDVNFDDVSPFLLALTCFDPDVHDCHFGCWPPPGIPPECPCLRANINGDSAIDFNDINWFVFLLTR